MTSCSGLSGFDRSQMDLGTTTKNLRSAVDVPRHAEAAPTGHASHPLIPARKDPVGSVEWHSDAGSRGATLGAMSIVSRWPDVRLARGGGLQFVPRLP